ncbi:MAG: NAD(P)/FAD-dependent oxidoreductase [Phycisphaerae bacterium]
MEASDDVLVIGGGIIGLTTAWQLAQRGASVTVLEQGRCAQAASRAALGALWPPPMARGGALQQLHRQSLWGYEDFIQSLQAASGLCVHYQRRGKVELLNSTEAFRTATEQCDAANTSWPALGDKPVMELLTGTQIRQYEPHISDAPHGAHLCRWSGQVNVDQLLEALITACIRCGVRIVEGVRIDHLESDSTRAVAAHAGGQKFLAENFVLCAGIGLPTITCQHELSPPITPVKGQALLLRVRKEVLTHIVKNGMIFLVPWQDGRILVGSTTEPEAGFDTTNTAEGVQFLLQGATQIAPALKAAAVERVWAGLRPTGPKHRPVMGKSPAFDNAFVCAGHFKIGIGLAPLAGKFMAELITTGRAEPGMEAFAFTGNAQ